MSASACSLVGADFCGPDSECINSTCHCSPTTLTSSEFQFYRLNDDLSEEDFSIAVELVPCGVNKAAHYVLYSLALLITLITLVMYITSIKKRSQLKRLVPYLICLLIFAILPIIKLADPAQDIGEDVFVTFIFAFTIWFITLSMHQFLGKYVNYHIRTLKIKERQNKKTLQCIQTFLKVNSGFGILISGVYIASAVVSKDDLVLAGTLFRVAQGLSGLSIFVVGVSEFYLLKALCDDVKMLQSDEERKNTVVGKIRKVKYSTVTAIMISALYAVLTAAYIPALESAIYFVPILLMLVCLSALIALVYNRGSKSGKSSSRQNSALVPKHYDTARGKISTKSNMPRRTTLDDVTLAETPGQPAAKPSIIGLGGVSNATISL